MTRVHIHVTRRACGAASAGSPGREVARGSWMENSLPQARYNAHRLLHLGVDAAGERAHVRAGDALEGGVGGDVPWALR